MFKSRVDLSLYSEHCLTANVTLGPRALRAHSQYMFSFTQNVLQILRNPHNLQEDLNYNKWLLEVPHNGFFIHSVDSCSVLFV